MVTKILVVDDEVGLERLIKQRFRKQIRANELEFVFAHNGREALEKLAEEASVSIVLTDINMPEMDGLTLLEKLSELDRTLRTVVISAYGDLQNIRTAMNRGAFDFLTKPIDFQDLEITINRTLEYVQKIKENLQRLQQAQSQLIQNEKLALIGQLVAGVAHEINNPVGFISGNLEYVETYIQDLLKLLELYQAELPNPSVIISQEIEMIELELLKKDLPQIIASMKQGTDRIRNLSTSLRTFSRSDSSQKVLYNIHDCLESTLMILKYRLKANNDRPEITVVKNYGDLPLLECYPGQLNQVFMNIIANAIEAIDELKPPENIITITTEVSQRSPGLDEEQKLELNSNSHIVIRISDTGIGLSELIRQCIFDPFFTTKPVGLGTGLGLSISKSIIVEKHQGTIECISTVGKGSEFIIQIPLSDGLGGR